MSQISKIGFIQVRKMGIVKTIIDSGVNCCNTIFKIAEKTGDNLTRKKAFSKGPIETRQFGKHDARPFMKNFKETSAENKVENQQETEIIFDKEVSEEKLDNGDLPFLVNYFRKKYEILEISKRQKGLSQSESNINQIAVIRARVEKFLSNLVEFRDKDFENFESNIIPTVTVNNITEILADKVKLVKIKSFPSYLIRELYKGDIDYIGCQEHYAIYLPFPEDKYFILTSRKPARISKEDYLEFSGRLDGKNVPQGIITRGHEQLTFLVETEIIKPSQYGNLNISEIVKSLNQNQVLTKPTFRHLDQFFESIYNYYD